MYSLISSIFDAKIAKRGGLVRRNIHLLREKGAYDLLVEEAKARGWPVWQMCDQLVVFCTRDPTIRRIT